MTLSLNPRPFVLGSALLATASASAQVANFDSMNSYVAPLEARFAEIRSVADGSAIGSGFSAGYDYNGFDVDQDEGRFQWETSWDDLWLSYGIEEGEWRFGALAAFQDGEVDSREINEEVPDPAFGRIDMEGWLGALFAEYQLHPLSFSFALGTGSADHEMDRSSDLGPTFGRSQGIFSTKSLFASTTARLEYELKEGSRFLFPFARLRYAEVDADGVAEVGGPDRRTVEAFSEEEISLEAGWDYTIRDRWYESVFTVSYWHDLSGDDALLAIGAANGTSLGTLAVPSSVDSLLFAGASFEAEFVESWTARLDLDYAVGNDADLVGFGLSLQRSF